MKLDAMAYIVKLMLKSPLLCEKSSGQRQELAGINQHRSTSAGRVGCLIAEH
jgi:hypothetical protein